MILLDFSQVVYGMIGMEFARNKNNTVDIKMLRHMILNKIRYMNVKFRSEYGRMIMAMDASPYWRKEVNPFYKGNRAIAQEKSLIDWEAIYKDVDQIKNEIITSIPIPYVKIRGAEADDVIATACSLAGDSMPVLILSTDKDFQQLQVYKHVEQWSPTQDKFIKQKNPVEFLRDHIIDGDAGDGIPNLLKPLDFFMKPKGSEKRVVMSQKRREQFKKQFTYDEGKINISLDTDEPLKQRILMHDRLINLVNVKENCPHYDAIAKELMHCMTAPRGKSPLFYFNSVGLKQLAGKTEDFFPAREG